MKYTVVYHTDAEQDIKKAKKWYKKQLHISFWCTLSLQQKHQYNYDFSHSSYFYES